MNKIMQSLINSYTVLVMAGRRNIEDVPETYTIGGQGYKLRELVEIEIAERTIAILV